MNIFCPSNPARVFPRAIRMFAAPAMVFLAAVLSVQNLRAGFDEKISFNDNRPISFNYTNAITNNGTASIYPLTVTSTGRGVVLYAEVTLLGLTHTRATDVQILLQSSGSSVRLLGGEGNITGETRLAFNNATLTLSDLAPTTFNYNTTGTFSSGTYKPSQVGSNDWDFRAPAPTSSSSYGRTLSVFKGLTTNNTTWNLYVADSVITRGGELSGWTLDVYTKYRFKWTGTGADNMLTTAKNWDDDISPKSNVQIELTFAGHDRLTPTMSSTNMRFTSIAFDSTAGAFILGGDGQYSLDEGIINNNTVAKQTITNRINIVSAALGIEGVQNSITELSGVISSNGAAPLYKGGEGLVMLTGSNTYTGNTIIGGGALQLGNGGATGSVNGDVLIYNAGNLVIKRSDNYIFGGSIGFYDDGSPTNTSQLTQDGSGAFTLTRAGSAVGVVNVYNGAMQFAQNGAFNAITSYDTYVGAATRISGSSKLATGAFRQAAGSTLDLTITSSNPIITATTATLSGTLKISDFWAAVSGSASGLPSSLSTIIRTENGIIGDFTDKVSGGLLAGIDYITLHYGVSADSKDYQLRYGLAWYDPDLAVAHGTFNIASGTGFLVDVALNDRAESITSGWDGKSLTKLDPGTLTLSASNNYTGTTTVKGGALNITGWTGSTASVVIGGNAGTSGTLKVTGTLISAADILVGSSGSGVMNIAQGGDASGKIVTIGSAGVGAVDVAGVLRAINTDGNTVVTVGGNSGTGSMNVSGTLYSTGHTYIGSPASSSGSVSVSGWWSSTGNIYVGNNGFGALTIAQSGSVSTHPDTNNYRHIIIGSGLNGTGTAYVEGLMDIAGFLQVGNSGTGWLTIAQDGVVKSNLNVRIGVGADSYGRVDVNGLLQAGSPLYVGSSGTGYLNIAGSGTVKSVGLEIGSVASASGSVNIAGAGLLDVGAPTSTVYIGNEGSGARSFVDEAEDAGLCGNKIPLDILPRFGSARMG